MRYARLPLLLLLFACGQEISRLDAGPGDAAPSAEDASGRDGGRLCLFGRPGAQTGLTDDQCKPTCDRFEVLPFTAEDAEALLSIELIDPPEVLPEDPYQGPPPDPSPRGAVCAVQLEDASRYRLATFDSTEDARRAGAQVTHSGACGMCSSLADLWVYLSVADLTASVRACGVLGIREGQESTRQCLFDLGFTPACAEIWFFNVLRTRRACLAECALLLEDPYHLPGGALNPCLACDERESGAIFKAVAGRTRRNSGIPTAICRPCDGVSRLSHRYPAD